MADRITTVDDYIAALPAAAQPILREVRAAIHRGVPHGEERIRYGMPAVMLGARYAIHFAGWKKHVGIYPVAKLDGALEADVAPYRSEKDSLRFVYAKPIPYDLVQRVAAAMYALRGG